MEELIKTYDEYLEFLDKCNNVPITMAYIHGWRESEDNIKKGEDFRAKIAELKNCA